MKFNKFFCIIITIIICLSLTACNTTVEPKVSSQEVQTSSEIVSSNASETKHENTSSLADSSSKINSSAILSSEATSSNISNIESKPSHTHTFSNATCSTPKTCSCGITKGSALGHNFKDATCTSAKKCSRCGTTEGSALGHNFKDATCTSAKKCSRCGTTEGSALGHNYKAGKCTRCEQTDPNYVKTYSVGETWVVDDQWEFTVKSVKKHSNCNYKWDEHLGLTGNEDVIIIEYSYKNIGYYKSTMGLYISSLNFSVFDQEGEAAERYACIHDTDPKECSITGTKCTASIAYVLKNPSSKILLSIRNMNTSNGTGSQTAQFNLQIS